MILAQPSKQFETFNELKSYIHARLCELEQLEVESFPLTQQTLKRSGEICGFLFSISGPRSIVFNAIYSTDQNAIHYYNSSGERAVSEALQGTPVLP